MARRRHRRRFHGITSLNLGNLPLIGESVNATDVLVGAVVGLAGAALAKALIVKFAPTAVPQIGKFIGAVTGLSSAAILYFANDKLMKNRHRGVGHAVGAAAVGLALTATDFLKEMKPIDLPVIGPLQFGSTVAVNLGGLLVADGSDAAPGYNGLLVADRSDNLNELAAYDMSIPDQGADDFGALAGLN